MSTRFWIGFRTILLGWSMALAVLVALAGGADLGRPWLVVTAIALFAALLFIEWRARTKAAAGGSPTQARNHAIALTMTGVVISLPVSAFGLYALPGLFGAVGLEAASLPTFGLMMAVALALGVSWVLADLWKYNCAPQWLES